MFTPAQATGPRSVLSGSLWSVEGLGMDTGKNLKMCTRTEVSTKLITFLLFTYSAFTDVYWTEIISLPL